MKKTIFAAVLLTISGCASSRSIEPTPTPVPDPTVPVVSMIDPSIDPIATVRPHAWPLDTCLGGGGELVEIGAVDNNDVADHGALLTFAISPGGTLAAAGADGTLKFWTLDAELLGVTDGSFLTYGSEIGASPITDLAWARDAEGAVVGDVRGLVQSMGPDGAFGVLGGTSPDVPIIAVAQHAESGTIAHAQWSTEVVPLVVRTPAAPVEIRDTLDTIRDLAFAADGTLAVAGSHEGAGTIELRSGAALDAVARIATDGAAIDEIAASRRGAIVAAVAPGSLAVLRDGALERVITGDVRGSVDLTPSGAFALTLADGAVVAHATDDGREAGRAPVIDAVRVRVDATGSRVIVGGSDAILHVFACVE